MSPTGRFASTLEDSLPGRFCIWTDAWTVR